MTGPNGLLALFSRVTSRPFSPLRASGSFSEEDEPEMETHCASDREFRGMQLPSDGPQWSRHKMTRSSGQEAIR